MVAVAPSVETTVGMPPDRTASLQYGKRRSGRGEEDAAAAETS